MVQDFFKYLPLEIIINILSRLPIRTVAITKTVCKSWLGLLETNEFIKSHLSKSSPGLAILQQSRSSEPSCKIYEFEDYLNLDYEFYYNLVTKFKLPFPGTIQGSVNGFLFLRDFSIRHKGFFICNPITREYIEIHTPKYFFDYKYPQVATFGFGVSRITGQYKVVRIFHDCVRDQDTHKLLGISKCECRVYTLGTRSWRSTTPSAPFDYSLCFSGTFLNGNLHWLVHGLNGKPWISCMDLETDLFSIISPPASFVDLSSFTSWVFALSDRLCVCCNNSSSNEIVIWLMMKYGDEKSWTKRFVVSNSGDYVGEPYDVARPIKVFENGDILMAFGDFTLFYSSRETGDIRKINMLEEGNVDSILHTSSFLSLKRFGLDNVVSF